jgi:hypothetical protein
MKPRVPTASKRYTIKTGHEKGSCPTGFVNGGNETKSNVDRPDSQIPISGSPTTKIVKTTRMVTFLIIWNLFAFD